MLWAIGVLHIVDGATERHNPTKYTESSAYGGATSDFYIDRIRYPISKRKVFPLPNYMFPGGRESRNELSQCLSENERLAPSTYSFRICGDEAKIKSSAAH